MTLLKLDKLTVKFGGLTAVHNVDCTVDAQQIFSVIGPNGAGKTTVFNAITGIYEATTGGIEFRGKTLQRPLTWRVLVACGLVGLATGLAAALLAIDVDSMWRATIKRNYAGPGSSFSYGAAWRDAVGYLRGALVIEPVRGGRWALRTADGRRTIAFAESREDAWRSRIEQQAILDAIADGADLKERDGRWVIENDSLETLASYGSEADGRAVIDPYRVIARATAAREARCVDRVAAGHYDWRGW